MVWDLRAALLKKQEVETARLLDCAFREQVRTIRLLAARLGPAADEAEMVRQVTRLPEHELPAWLAARFADQADALPRLLTECRAEARAQLIQERGDPTPYRLS